MSSFAGINNVVMRLGIRCPLKSLSLIRFIDIRIVSRNWILILPCILCSGVYCFYIFHQPPSLSLSEPKSRDFLDSSYPKSSLIWADTVNALIFRTLYIALNYNVFIRVEFNKMLVRIANMGGPDQNPSSEAV